MYRAALIVLFGVVIWTSSPGATKRQDSSVSVKGLGKAAEILVDRWGVPHIYASSRQDAFFAQGWNAARERLWQIDMWRRTGLGELAAVFGRKYMDQDRAIRLFTYRGDMEKEWQSYGADARENTESFVAGINAFVAAARSDAALMPVEFKLAHYEPGFWKADDVVRIRNHGLAFGASLQVLRAQVMCKTGSLVASELLAKVSPPWTPIIPEGLDPCVVPAGVLDSYWLALKPFDAGLLKLNASRANEWQPDLRRLDQKIADQGSNNWVVGPAKSATGRPILANDPHRALELPSLRYVVHIVAPGLNVIGAGEPALPGIAIGHNDDIAFGITVFFIGQEDLYVYDTNPSNANEYRYQNQWRAMHILHESIAVRGSADQQVELKFTQHGPVIFEDTLNHRAFALRATWLDSGGAPYFAAMRYLRAKNISQFKDALKYWGEPGENHVYADTKGHIGWFPAGFTPVRRNSDGLLPLPGDGRYEWAGYYDRSLLPSEIDPPREYIATANQMNLPENFPYAERRVGFYWGDDARFKRITNVLEVLPKVSVRDSEELQNDKFSVPSRRLIRILGGISTSDEALQSAISWLKDWDGRVTEQSPQAALYEVWVSRHLRSAVIAQAAPESVQALLGAGSLDVITNLMESPDKQFGPNPQQRRDEIMLQTLKASADDLADKLGPDRSGWQWGKLATILFEHPFSPLSDETTSLDANVGPHSESGDADVVGVASYRPEDYRVVGGASFRMVLDVGRWDNSVAINAPGQSGDMLSPHYRDLFHLWVKGKYFPLAYSRVAVERATERRIALRPASSQRLRPQGQ